MMLARKKDIKNETRFVTIVYILCFMQEKDDEKMTGVIFII